MSEERIYDQKEVSEVIPDYMEIYSEEVNTDRAIPALEDGLKPVHRRILWSAHNNKISSKSKHMKLARLSGDVIGKYHPHSDSATNGATVTLAQTWVQRLPFIDPQGSVGDIWGNGAAAARYLEVRMTHPAELMLKDIDRDASEMQPNYDNTEKEPRYLPSALPNALINSNTGIGYGMSTDTLPHNPKELLEGAIAYIKDPEITDEELLKIIPGPDFPTGGQVLRTNGKTIPAMDEMKNGQASYLVRGHISIEEEGKRKKKTLLVIDQIPYGTNAQRILDQVSQIMIDRQKLLGVESVGNESIDGKLRIVIRLSDDSKVDVAKSLIFRFSDMEKRISCQNNMLVDGRPKIVNIHYYLRKWTEYRRKVLSRVVQFDQNKISARLNIVNGLLKLVDHADEIVKLAKASNGKQDLVKTLIEKYDFNDAQANAIAALPLYRLGKQDTMKLSTEKKELEEKHKINEKILSDKSEMDKFMINDMQNTIKELENDTSIDVSRKTKIVDEFKSVDLDMNKLDQKEIDVKPMKVVIREDGIMHRMTPRVFDNNIEDARKIRPIIKDFDATTVDWAMAFTDNGTVITRMVNDLANINPKYDVESFYKQVPDFKTDQIFVGGALFNEEIRKENPLILSITQMGLAKLSELQRSMPNTSNRGYLKRMTVYNGIKNRAKGDKIAIATVVSQEDIKTKKFHIELEDGTIIEHDLSDISIQGQGGSGGRKVPGFLRKDIKDWSIIDK